MKKILMSAAGLAALAACAAPVPMNNAVSPAPLVIPVAPEPAVVPPPAPVTTSSLDGPAAAPTPLPSTNGMAPPPVEIGVVGPVPEELPTFTPTPAATTPLGGSSAPLVMDEDM
ncbi:hypothetical protein SAMN05444339_104158 [Loktanella atrilutea]|uniref:Uncharacterized protein n=1 Tax=Loktanella atrilutea TaxID=366533 RepID=A0A1M4ZWP2_LOKAT|nr:hypothetical protein [Loktanella atrilutea]SHF22459.1 hypothetical protein SAMN05444339_104158 [Loktanella atrilutea]